ncbi:MAG: MarR family winged helix-turn-helix transcriptional regulator [Acidimicrobiales bacterium]
MTDAGSNSTSAHGARDALTLEQSVGFRLSRVARARKRAWSEELEVLTITPAQASALRAIVERPDLSLRALARTLGTDPMSAKRCVDDLEARELVLSTTAQRDRRPRLLNATKQGRALAREIDRRVRRQEAVLRTVLSAREYETLVKVLGRLEEHLDLVGISDVVIVEKGEC